MTALLDGMKTARGVLTLHGLASTAALDAT